MKNIKRLLCICLIACICLCAVGCKKNTDNSSSVLSSTVTQTETSSIDSKIESTEENTSTEESKVSAEDKTDTVESETNKEDSKTNSLSNSSSISKPQNATTNSNKSQSSNTSKTEINANEDLDKKVDELFLKDGCKKITITEDIFYNVVDVILIDGVKEGIITKDGSVYLISPNLNFSNGKNYKKIETNIKIVSYHYLDPYSTGWGEYYYLSDDFKLYSLIKKGEFEFEFVYYDTIEKYCNNPRNIIRIQGDMKDYSYFENNTIYKGKNREVSYSFPQDEIIEFYGSYIKTNKGNYVLKSVYEQEYVDVPGEYKTVCEKSEIPYEVNFAWSGSTGWSFGVYKNILYYGALFI